MKTFNIQPRPVKIGEIEISAVVLGEKGRGRTQTIVPCPENDLLEPGLSKTNRPRLNPSSSNAGWLSRISTEGSYVRGANGNVSAPPSLAGMVQVVAKGNGAFGDAGRIGTWVDLILATHLESFHIRVKPSRGDAYILLFQEGATPAKISYSEAEALDLDLCSSTSTSKGEMITF